MITYMHFHCGEGRITAAIKLPKDRRNPLVEVGLSYCSPKDRFTREMGRALSKLRLMDGESEHKFKFIAEDGKPAKAQVWDHLRNIVDAQISPQWTRGCIPW